MTLMMLMVCISSTPNWRERISQKMGFWTFTPTTSLDMMIMIMLREWLFSILSLMPFLYATQSPRTSFLPVPLFIRIGVIKASPAWLCSTVLELCCQFKNKPFCRDSLCLFLYLSFSLSLPCMKHIIISTQSIS